jgi:hypothetical protein
MPPLLIENLAVHRYPHDHLAVTSNLTYKAFRPMQAVAVARALDALAAETPGHVIVAGDMDADEAGDTSGSGTVGMSSMT